MTIVAYSPLGKGVLTGKHRDPAQFAAEGIRGNTPRFNGEVFQQNLKLVDEFERLATKKGCTAGQLAIAWVQQQGAIPIPGTKSVHRLEENWGAHKVELSSEELDEIRKAITDFEPSGNR